MSRNRRGPLLSGSSGEKSGEAHHSDGAGERVRLGGLGGAGTEGDLVKIYPQGCEAGRGGGVVVGSRGMSQG